MPSYVLLSLNSVPGASTTHRANSSQTTGYLSATPWILCASWQLPEHVKPQLEMRIGFHKKYQGSADDSKRKSSTNSGVVLYTTLSPRVIPFMHLTARGLLITSFQQSCGSMFANQAWHAAKQQTILGNRHLLSMYLGCCSYAFTQPCPRLILGPGYNYTRLNAKDI